MSLQYSHLLIPDRPDFTPEAAQVAAFLQNIADIASAPLEATIRVGKSSGKVRTGINPLTGEKISIPRRDFVVLAGLSEIPATVVGLDEYDVLMSGQGPPKVPPFPLYTVSDSKESGFTGTYGYEVLCHLRKAVVSTCEEPPYGVPCQTDGRNGVFHHPITGATIEVANAACARFWIRFQFGKRLLPRIEASLNLLQPAILQSATEIFGPAFAQGCICG